MKIIATVETKNDKGEVISLDQPKDNKVFELVPPGRYVAIVRSIKSKIYGSNVKYLALTPKIELKNENHSLITRQDFTVGAVRPDGSLYRPDGDDSKSLIWTGSKGAAYLLLALGLLKKSGDGLYEINADPDKVFDRAIVVKIDHEEYKAKDGTTRKKNAVIQIFPMNADEASDAGFVVDENGVVFETELALSASQNLNDDENPDF